MFDIKRWGKKHKWKGRSKQKSPKGDFCGIIKQMSGPYNLLKISFISIPDS